jgi:hypothetical protein
LWVSSTGRRAMRWPDAPIVNRVTQVDCPGRLYRGPYKYRRVKMENRTDFVTVVMALCVAAYAAVTLDYVANVDLGFSCEQIRNTAVITAVVMAMLMAIDFLGKKLGKADRPQ